MSNTRQYFRIDVSQTSRSPKTLILNWSRFSSPDLRIKFKLFKTVKSVWVTDECDVGILNDQSINLEAEKVMTVPHGKLFSDQSRSMVRDILSSMNIPKVDHSKIVLGVFDEISLALKDQTARSLAAMSNIAVDLYDVTLHLQNINDDPKDD